MFNERFLLVLDWRNRAALRTLARQDGVTQSACVRSLLEREAQQRGLWPGDGSKEEVEHARGEDQ